MQGILWFHVNCTIVFSISVKNTIVILKGSMLNLYIVIGRKYLQKSYLTRGLYLKYAKNTYNSLAKKLMNNWLKMSNGSEIDFFFKDLQIANKYMKT